MNNYPIYVSSVLDLRGAEFFILKNPPKLICLPKVRLLFKGLFDIVSDSVLLILVESIGDYSNPNNP